MQPMDDMRTASCPKCGTENDPGTIVCRTCGLRFEDEESRIEESIEEARVGEDEPGAANAHEPQPMPQMAPQKAPQMTPQPTPQMEPQMTPHPTPQPPAPQMEMASQPVLQMAPQPALHPTSHPQPGMQPPSVPSDSGIPCSPSDPRVPYAPSMQPPYPPQGMPPVPIHDPYAWPLKPPKHGLAIASLVLGIVGCAFDFMPMVSWIGLCCGIVAIILAGVAKSRGNRTAMSTAGLVLGIVSVGLWVLGLFVLLSMASFMMTYYR